MRGFRRRRPSHPNPISALNRPTIVLVTVGAAQRRRILASEGAHLVLLRAWRRADAWQVGRYVVMPDHIHLFCAPRRLEIPLARWIHFWKADVTRQWPWGEERPIWQPDSWDTQLRRLESYRERWSYVHNNPVRAGLVSRADDWPFQGELAVLEWWEA